MEWSTATTEDLKALFNKSDYKAWSNAIQNGQIDKFSEDLSELTEKLSRILVAELECKVSERGKIIKFMELVALAGKTL